MDEFLNRYRQRLEDTVRKVSPCPYCGLPRIVVKHFEPVYSEGYKVSYEVQHMDEEKAVEAKCFTMFYAFESVEEAIERADERDGGFKPCQSPDTLLDGDESEPTVRVGKRMSDWDRY